MKIFKRITTVVLIAILVVSPVTGGILGLRGSAADSIIESPILPIIPSDPETGFGLSYMFDDKNLTAKVIDFTDSQATTVVIPKVVADGEKTYTVNIIAGAAFSAESNLEIVVLPETGGAGTLPLAIIGITLTVLPILYSTIRRKRERRLT